MKNSILLALCVAAALPCSLLAQNTATMTATPDNNILNPGDTFNVTFAITSGPTVVSGFDLFLESNSTNVDNNFSITMRTVAAGTNAGTPTYPDVISTSTSDHSGFAQNANDQGVFFTTDQNAPGTLVTLQLQVAAGTPAGTYTFFTTSSSAPENKQTLVFGGPDTMNDLNQYSVTQTSFSVTVVPEPATWSLMALGGLASLGLGVIRRRA